MSLHHPLAGTRIVEFEAIGPCPMAGRILCDMGAEVTLLARPAPIGLIEQLLGDNENPLHEGKQVRVLDLKQSAADRRVALDLIAGSDAIIEGLRPGVMERLDLGPADCAKINPKLVYGRMTGWGQSGPLAQAAGHDLNYVALSGLLSLSSRAGEAPIVPPTVVGDAAGALGLAMGVVSALLDIRNGGPGRVVDSAICDVAAMLGMLAQMYEGIARKQPERPSVFHDSPFYDAYQCACGGFVSLAAMEPQFYAQLLELLGLEDVDRAAQYDEQDWPGVKDRIAGVIAGKTREEWTRLLEGTDVCFAPVLSVHEASRHPHNRHRDCFRETASGVVLGNTAPRFLPFANHPEDTSK